MRNHIFLKITSLLIIVGLLGATSFSIVSHRQSSVFSSWLKGISADLSSDLDFSQVSNRNTFFTEAAQLIKAGKIDLTFPVSDTATSDDIEYLLQSIWFGYSDAAGMNSIPTKLPNLETFGISFISYLSKVAVGFASIVSKPALASSVSFKLSAFIAVLSSLPFLSGIAIGAP